MTCYAVCLVGSFATSCVTTVCLWLDSLIYDYYSFAFVFGSAPDPLWKGYCDRGYRGDDRDSPDEAAAQGGLVPALN